MRAQGVEYSYLCQASSIESIKAETRRGKLKGLTSKEHLFLRVLSVVATIDAVTFYAASRNLQTLIANFTEVITLITVLTLFVLTINLEFWWRYLRRRDNLRFWKPQKPLTEEVSWMFSLLYDLILRAIIIVAVTDAIIFYLISTKNIRVLRFGYGTLAFLVIVVTLIPLLINIWFVLWRYGVLNVR
jgi:hypothetical protein